MKKLFKFLKDEEGIEMVEWALMAALFALAVIVGVSLLGTQVNSTMQSIADTLSGT